MHRVHPERVTTCIGMPEDELALPGEELVPSDSYLLRSYGSGVRCVGFPNSVGGI